jgi:hypothetical protein
MQVTRKPLLNLDQFTSKGFWNLFRKSREARVFKSFKYICPDIPILNAEIASARLENMCWPAEHKVTTWACALLMSADAIMQIANVTFFMAILLFCYTQMTTLPGKTGQYGQ